MTYEEEIQFKVLLYMSKHERVSLQEGLDKLDVNLNVFANRCWLIFDDGEIPANYTINKDGQRVLSYLIQKRAAEKRDKHIVYITLGAAIIAAIPILQDWICKLINYFSK